MNQENKGWICPKCEKVFAPSVEECKACNEGITKGEFLDALKKSSTGTISIPFVQVIDGCQDGGPHDYPMHQVGDIACRKCGKFAGNPISWTATTTGITSSTGSGQPTYFVKAKGSMDV